MIYGLLLLCALATGACGAASAQPRLTAYGLEVEARTNPVGVDVIRPRFGWRLRSSIRGERQTAYQILVALSREVLDANRGTVWNSERVASDETGWIAYGGAPLRSFQRYWWKVRVWDADGAPSAWSEPAEWTMAILSRRDWKAGWIAYPDSKLTSGPLPIFRKEIRVDRALRRALVFVIGAGFHEVRINGVKAGNHVLAPAWTNYRDTTLYEVLDVTTLLRRGPNALGVLVGNGFYNVVGGRYTKYTGSFGHPRLCLQLHLEYEDDTSQDIGTDASWRVQRGPITFSCIYGGEDFDARMEPQGWDRPGFDDSGWLKPSGSEGAGGDARAQSSPPIRVQEVYRPVRIAQPKPGVFVYDLGQNFAGWPKIEVSGPAGTTVRMIPGELLDASGLVSQLSSGGPQWFSYTLRGSGRESWAPRFSYYGFRYVQVEGAAPESSAVAGAAVMHSLEGQFIHLDAARVGKFETSNTLLNRIHTLIQAAVRSNLQHVLTDCPHREKLGWLEQLYLMGPSLLYKWDLRTFLPKAVHDIREAQTANGLIPGIAPEYVTFGWSEEGFRDSPEWGSAGIQVPWIAWQWYGDRSTLDDSYRAMKRYAEYLVSRSENGLLTYGLGDWYDIGPRGPGVSQLTPQGITATATFFADLKVLHAAARLLGRDEDAHYFSEQEKRVHEAFQRKYYDGTRATYATGSQTALAMPLALGMAPDSARAALVEKLVADIRARGNHTSAGDIGYSYVIRALVEAGRNDTLFDMATRTDPPSYGAQLAAGATSLTEAWDADPRSSQNHLMLGHIEQWFYGGLAGIRPDLSQPGLRHIDVRPEVVGDLTRVAASWETFRGPVMVRWTVDGDVFRLSVEVPPGMTADIFVPAASRAEVREGGAAVADGRGLRFVREEAGHVVFDAGSGHYEFEVRGFRRPARPTG